MRILIVDDEQYTREDLHNAVERVSEASNEYDFAQDYSSALELVGKKQYDIAFLDIQMPGKNGIMLAESIKRISPSINIIIVTAYDRYALDALRLYVSAYLLKPVMDDDLKRALDNLRNPVADTEKKLDVVCFGNFEVFVGGKPFVFKRKKEKELLAYLICLRGATSTRSEICSTIFEEKEIDKSNAYFKTIVAALRGDFLRYGIEDILLHANNSYSVDVSKIRCDYYDYLKGVAEADRCYKGEFLNQYSWAESYIYSLDNYI